MTYNVNNDIWKLIFKLHDNKFDFVITGGIADNINFNNKKYKNLLEVSDIDIVVQNKSEILRMIEFFNIEPKFGYFGVIPIWGITVNNVRIDIILDNINSDNINMITTNNISNINVIGRNLKYYNDLERINNIKYILEFAYMDKDNMKKLRNDKILKYLKKLTIYNSLI